MMRVMVFAKATEDSENRVPPTPEAWAAMDRYQEELADAGILVAAAGLKPTAEAVRISVDGEERTVATGPFPGDGQVIAGFSIWQVRDMDEAVAWAKRCPSTGPGRSEMEIRPFFEAADLAEHLTPEELANPHGGDRGRLGVA